MPGLIELQERAHVTISAGSHTHNCLGCIRGRPQNTTWHDDFNVPRSSLHPLWHRYSWAHPLELAAVGPVPRLLKLRTTIRSLATAICVPCRACIAEV